LREEVIIYTVPRITPRIYDRSIEAETGRKYRKKIQGRKVDYKSGGKKRKKITQAFSTRRE